MNAMTDNERVELNELISALVDGRASAAEHSRLEKMLAVSDEARRFYVRSMAMSASLFERAGEMQGELPEPTNIVPFSKWSRWAMPLAAAAAVLLGIFLARTFFGPGPPGKIRESAIPATTTAAAASGASQRRHCAGRTTFAGSGASLCISPA